ncbi:glycosyltransferase family 4 protein [Luteimicrobium sp. NPDC057192]|uniref:glycosyltransferase family 4 protein n=1 Tax=Luteimicrobium sp. NPDC057192 TaxID=3346042 RepID=UPI00362EBA5B
MSRPIPSDARLRVVVLDHTADLGGGELALARLCEALDPAEVRVRVIVFADGPLVGRLRDGGTPVEVVRLGEGVRGRSRDTLGAWASVRSAWAAVPFVWRLARRLRTLRPDVVHTQSLKADVLGSVAAAVARAPVVWHVHDRVADDYLPARVARVFRWLAERVPRAVVANSEATAATLPPGAVVAYPGFAPEQVRPDGARERVDPSPPVVGLVGRISPTKGQLELVRAVPAVLAAHPGARFRLVGAPLFGGEDYAADVTAEIARLGLGDAVEVVGHVDDVAAVLDGLSVLVHASPVPEPFGQVVVEGMVRGVPVVAADAGGVTEILRGDDGPLGVLVPPGDSDALAAAVVGVLDDPAASRARAVAAYDAALERFPVARAAATVTATWRTVAARRGARRA